MVQIWASSSGGRSPASASMTTNKSDVSSSNNKENNSYFQGNKNKTESRILMVDKQPCQDALASKGLYSGPLQVSTGLPHGPDGTMVYADNHPMARRYQGDWLQGNWHGQCTLLKLSNGDDYQGDLQHGERHGQGVYTWAPATMPAVVTTENTIDGTTITTTVQEVVQRIYCGSFVQNQRCGQGKYTWKTTTTTTIATVTEGTTTSTTTSTNTSESTYVGGFDEHGQRSGHGVYTSPRLCYKGSWHQGVFHGPGELVETTSSSSSNDNDEQSPTTTIYRGNFDRGMKHGLGILLLVEKNKEDESTKTRTLFDGKWYRDEQVIPEGGNDEEDVDDIPALTASATNTEPTTAIAPAITPKSAAQGSWSSPSSSKAVTTTLEAEPRFMVDNAGRKGWYKGMVLVVQAEGGVILMPHGVGTMKYQQDYKLISYEGFWQAGIFHGFGRLKLTNGDFFEGNFENGALQGEGKYTTKRGTLYKGTFHQGLLDGNDVSVIYWDGNIYEGSYAQGLRNGFGKLEFADTGSYYQGDFLQGNYHGNGTLVGETGVYTGEFARGVFEGLGCLRNASSNLVVFEGPWNNGRPANIDEDGTGGERGHEVEVPPELLKIPEPPKDQLVAILEDEDEEDPPDAAAVESNDRLDNRLPSPTKNDHATPNADSDKPISSLATSLYKTLVTKSSPKVAPVNSPSKDDCRPVVDRAVDDGQGNSGRYTGLFDFNTKRPHGVGRMVYSDGQRIHEGFWVYGHREGHGRCAFLGTGDLHEGNYHQNLRQGPGAYYWQDGRVFKGNYHQDERHGLGRFTYPNGDVYEGNFERGQRQGQGSFIFGHGAGRYEGSWLGGIYHGSGRLEWTNRQGKSHCYQGEFAHGMTEGTGVETVDGVVVREGKWIAGKYVGADVVVSIHVGQETESIATSSTTEEKQDCQGISPETTTVGLGTTEE